MIFGSLGTSVPERDSSFFFFFQISYINIRLWSDPESSSPVYVNNFQTAKIYILNGILDRFLICFFYLKRRNLSLDNRKRITTIYVTVWKLFTYTGLELSGSDHNRILIYEIWKKKKKKSLSLGQRCPGNRISSGWFFMTLVWFLWCYKLLFM